MQFSCNSHELVIKVTFINVTFYYMYCTYAVGTGHMDVHSIHNELTGNITKTLFCPQEFVRHVLALDCICVSVCVCVCGLHFQVVIVMPLLIIVKTLGGPFWGRCGVSGEVGVWDRWCRKLGCHSWLCCQVSWYHLLHTGVNKTHSPYTHTHTISTPSLSVIHFKKPVSLGVK